MELASFLPTELPACFKGDPGRIRQVLLNLVGNGVKFTESGEVFVHAALEAETETHAHLRIEVNDTGIGIAPATLSRLFRPFTQADSSTTRKYGGTGLGLAISKRLIEQMGGSIGARSTVGRGSTFWFVLPLEKQSDPQPPRANGTLAGLRSLVVDDNATNRKILHYQATAWKMENTCVPGGSEAIALLQEQAAAGTPFDLVVLDMQMPGMDGLAVASWIRSSPELAQVRVVVLTSLGQALPPSILSAHGISACLFKPIRQSEFYNALVNVMYQEAPSRVAPAIPSAPTNLPAHGPLLLLAEDNLVNQKVARKQLQKLGYSVDVVSNGQEALDALPRRSYRAVLMDCHMPVMDGYEATRRIREHEAAHHPGSRIRIIAMTADAMVGDRENCLACGMDDYISKPVHIEALKKLLEKHLGKRAMEAAETSKSPSPALPPDAFLG